MPESMQALYLQRNGHLVANVLLKAEEKNENVLSIRG